jgi:Uma2 family endonuclease/parvulin-like peptidyl-prolyl isomerase
MTRAVAERRSAQARWSLDEIDHLVLDGVSWELYEHLLKVADKRRLSMTYDNGELEIMSPPPEHEWAKTVIGDLIKAITEELDMPRLALGSTTFRRRLKKKGLEPDDCFYIQNQPRIVGKKRIHLPKDPPPDIAIEIEITRRCIAKLPIYAALGVPEIWRYDGKKLQCLRLDRDSYREVQHSVARSSKLPRKPRTRRPRSRLSGHGCAGRSGSGKTSAISLPCVALEGTVDSLLPATNVEGFTPECSLKRFVLILCCVLITAARGADEAVVARVNGQPITMQQLEKPLIEGYGLNVLLSLVQLELAKQEAAKAHVTVSPADIQAERTSTIDKMFKDSNAMLQDKLDRAVEKNQTAAADKLRQQIHDDNERAFKQFLDNQHKSEAEFAIVVETNTCLRKITEPLLAGKITDESLKEAFAAIYGETVECRHIQCANLQEIQQAKKRLADGEPFEKFATEMNRNEGTRQTGGRVPPFSRQTQGLPQAFKDAAFALKPGEVSDIVQAEGAFHLILLEKRNPPKIVKFEDVKDSLKKDLYERAVEVTVKQLRQQITQQALKSLVIEEPVMKKQLETKLAERQIQDQEEIKRQMERDREREKETIGTKAPATLPGS